MSVESSSYRIATLVAAALLGCQAHSQPAGLLSPGAKPPDLSGVDQSGQMHHLSESNGHFTVVYFYPKDDTPGCTKEACAFRDVWNKYRVSVDDQGSHASFAQKYSLPFPIIVDKDTQWVKGFGVPLKMGVATRVSFLLSPDGRVNKVYPNVDPGTHASLVLQDVSSQSR